MDAGLGGWSLDWSAVQPEIAQFTRVCSYDRAGLRWSEPGTAPGNAQQAVDDLHALLASSGERGPFVLVGHSNGGLRVVLYANNIYGKLAVQSRTQALVRARALHLL
jgi:pimeloyl-ACP methyl ester carboxylesterase